MKPWLIAFIIATATIEQMFYIAGSIYLVEVRGFSWWAYFWAAVLVYGCSASIQIKAVLKAIPKEAPDAQ